MAPLNEVLAAGILKLSGWDAQNLFLTRCAVQELFPLKPDLWQTMYRQDSLETLWDSVNGKIMMILFQKGQEDCDSRIIKSSPL